MAPKLSPVPEIPSRALGLVRVSDEHGRGDQLVSPEIQRAAIAAHAARYGYDLTGFVEGIDESGSRAKSSWWAKLDKAIDQLEAGEYDVLVVWKFSRAARHRLRWAVALERVDTAGGRLESATEQVDVTTSAGRFTRGMFGEVAAFEAERIGEGWREAHAARVRSGRPHTGKPKWGYTYDPVAKLHRPDPETGPVLADLYRRYVAGESVYSLTRWLNAHGYRTTTGGRWADRSLRRVLGAGFAAGKFTVHGELRDGIHEPLIDPALWQAFLDVRLGRAAAPSRRARSQYLLSGLVRCARCGWPMVAGQFGAQRAPKYRCRTAKEQGPEACPGGYVMASYVERHVYEWLTERDSRVDESAEAASAAMAWRAVRRTDAEQIGREVAKVHGQLTQLALRDAETPYPPEVFSTAHQKLTERLAILEAEQEAALREARQSVVDPGGVTAGLLAGWETTPVAVRRDVLRSLMDCVLVTTGRPAARFRIVEAWEVR